MGRFLKNQLVPSDIRVSDCDNGIEEYNQSPILTTAQRVLTNYKQTLKQ